MTNTSNKTRVGCISIYHEAIPRELAKRACDVLTSQDVQKTMVDGKSGSGINKQVKDSLGVVPKYMLPHDHPLNVINREIEAHVFKCIMDYYRDNPGMLYGIGGYELCSQLSLPDPAFAFARSSRMQTGQYQWYKSRGDKNGGGYPANHAESVPNARSVKNEQDNMTRSLTWMLTLNDLSITKEQYGYTVFTNQKIAVRPVAGQLVLFSPWYDCEHRGNRVKDEDKIIVTSWCAADGHEFTDTGYIRDRINS